MEEFESKKLDLDEKVKIQKKAFDVSQKQLLKSINDYNNASATPLKESYKNNIQNASVSSNHSLMQLQDYNIQKLNLTIERFISVAETHNQNLIKSGKKQRLLTLAIVFFAFVNLVTVLYNLFK